jgi:alpha-mannosidase
LEKIGKVSGNLRLDPDLLTEPDNETEQTREMWFDALDNDPDYLQEMNEEFEKGLEILSKDVDTSKVRFFYIGKSHLDLAYKWRFEQTIKKAILTLGKAVYHCERFPNNFQFCFSAPQAFAWIKEYDPSLFQKIQYYVNNG